MHYLLKMLLYFFLFFIFSQQLMAEGGSNNPEVTISPSSKTITEGNSGTKSLTFTISINKCPDTKEIKIKYTTANGSAQSGSDYVKKDAQLIFNTNSCTKSHNITINIKGDTKKESDEKFYIRLSDNGTNSYQNYHFGNQQSTITIKNDDKDSVADLSITKSNNKGNKKVKIGEVVEYTINAKNNGPKASKIFVWDTIPNDMKFISVNADSSNFNCNYNSSDNKVRCSGSRVFNRNESVNIYIKAKLTKNRLNSITNYAGVLSDSNPKLKDNNSANNKDNSTISIAKADLRLKKSIQKKSGYDIGDIVKFKITFGNYNTHEAKAKLYDKLPSSLKLQDTWFIGSKPNNFECSKDFTNNSVTCTGEHLFKENEEYSIYITAKAIKKGRVVNKAKIAVTNNLYESKYGNNHSSATVDIGINSSNEKIKASKTIINEKPIYYLGDEVTFLLEGVNQGFKEYIKIKDWLSKYGTTNNIFEFINIKANSNNIECSKKSSGRNLYIECKSKNQIDTNEKFNALLTLKIKNLPSYGDKVCNKAHFYKKVDYSDGAKFKWYSSATKCFTVKKPKAKPILNADTFYVKLNEYKTIDLKKYTTDEDTPKEKLQYTILSGSLPDGYTMTQGGTISGKYTNSNGVFPKEFNLKVKVTDDDGLSGEDEFKIVVKASDIIANDNIYKIPIKQILNGNLITDSGDNFNADIGEKLSLISIEPNDSKLQWKADGSFSFKAPNSAAKYQFKYKIKDKYGQEDYALLKIEVYKPKIKAKDDIFKVAKNTPIYANLFSDNKNGIDIGDDIKIINHTNPLNGKLGIKEDGTITYTPNSNYTGNDKFTYTIKDRYGQKDSATVFLTIGTLYTQNYVDFNLVNPPETRNLIGNYITIGNSVECITEKKDSFDGTCSNNKNLGNNNYVVKYIDVDGSSTALAKQTWNSSSANFTLPNSLIDSNKSIAWAGLFWQGSINNREGFKQRRADTKYGKPYGYKNITKDEPIELSSTNANKVLIRVDDKNIYQQVKADTFYNDLAHGELGGYYAAYANITSLLQQENLKYGKHKITVANILSNEGRESDIGNYAGWSLVLIYKEGLGGKARNISVYNGYQAIGKGGSTNIPSKEVKISGFRLPKYGDVDSKISAFVGEGEKVYGGTSIVYDKMYIKDINTNNTYDMPSINPNNIFDASIENIERDSKNYNNISNTNGIDVDTYDVSNIMKKIRDNKVNTDSIKIGIISKDNDLNDGDQSDYITASMIAFSTELYAPKVCYDYNIKLGDYIDIESSDRNFTASNYANAPLELKLLIRSQEADFDLIESKLKAEFVPSDIFKYIPNSSKTSIPNTTNYHKAIDTDIKNGQISVGSNDNINGGIIGAKELIYSKLYYKFLKSNFQGKFDVVLDAKISFDGINKVPYQLSTKAPKNSIFYISRCDSNPIYDPIYGIFNIERGDSTFSQKEDARYSLPTQVTGVPYQISIAAYQKDKNNKFNKEAKANTTVELELIDGNNFDNNRSAGFDSVCQDPDSYNKGTFVRFNNNSRVKLTIPKDYPTYPNNLALKNAVFRVWVLTKTNSKGDEEVINHNCKNQNDSSCFDKIYKEYYSSLEKNTTTPICSNSCTNSSGSSCYDCLKQNYATPICSRDNFAIRPESYSISIYDNNENNSSKSKYIGLNDSSIKHISAGYLYPLDINSTIFNKRENTIGYYFKNNKSSSYKKSIAKFVGDKKLCDDTEDIFLNLLLINGKTLYHEKLSNNNTMPKNSVIINNSGLYNIDIEDSEWTRVDQKGYKYKPFPDISDCKEGSSSVDIGNLNSKSRGCSIKNGFNAKYPSLALASHPYTFNIDNISVKSNPNSGSNYIYVNDLNSTKQSIIKGSAMGLNVSGSIVALGKNKKVLSNYKNGCSAYDLNIKLDYNTSTNPLKDTLGKTVNLEYSIYDNVVNGNSVNVYKANKNRIDTTFSKKYFYTPSKASYNKYINFERSYNGTINPFKLYLGIMEVNSPKEKLTVNMINNYIPKVKRDLNQSKTFYYAKVKSKANFYDDIYDKDIETPIIVNIFCNKSLDYCSKYGINISKSLTKEYDWWLALKHDASKGDGKAILDIDTSKDSSAKNKIEVKPSIADKFVKAIDNNIKVAKKKGALISYPYTVYIKPKQEMVDNYPYLLFNKYNNKVPSYLYKVRFVDSGAAWSGKGKTGFTTDINSTGRRNKKVDW